MMTLDFFRSYAATRMAFYDPQPSLLQTPFEDEEDESAQVSLNLEMDADRWVAQSVVTGSDWRASDWPERPTRFVDGKDSGRIVAWLRAPGDYPVPVRLAEIGSVTVRVIDGVCYREFALVERVVSMIVDLFPWDEVESLAAALQEHGFRLLPARCPEKDQRYDFEEMRRPTSYRSTTEMFVMEEAALAQDSLEPTVVDGRLEPHSGGFDQNHSPVIGVIKSHSRNYLHPQGMQLLYALEPGERTPLFALPNAKLPVVSWYLRLSGSSSAMPNWGIVRVELPLRWFEQQSSADGMKHVKLLSRTLCEYRCRESSYARAAVSLHPIVRAEQLLGALFSPTTQLTQRFYRLTHL